MQRAVYSVLAIALLLTGCTATPLPAGPATPAPTVEPIDAAQTCKEVSTLVLTQLANADVAFREKRISQAELDGTRRGVAEALVAIDAEPGTDIFAALAGLRVVTGVTVPLTYDPSSPEWRDAMGPLSDACEAEGHELFVNMWTGG